MPGSSAAEVPPAACTGLGDEPAESPPARRVLGRARGVLVRVDPVTLALAGLGLVLIVAATVFVTLLASGRGGGTSPARAQRGPAVTLDGTAVAAYITSSFGAADVTCPTVSTPVGSSFLCSDRAGDSFTVTIVDNGRAYSVHPS